MKETTLGRQFQIQSGKENIINAWPKILIPEVVSN
jgi:hypothetical protein